MGTATAVRARAAGRRGAHVLAHYSVLTSRGADRSGREMERSTDWPGTVGVRDVRPQGRRDVHVLLGRWNLRGRDHACMGISVTVSVRAAAARDGQKRHGPWWRVLEEVE